jgi:hypothetical protein
VNSINAVTCCTCRANLQLKIMAFSDCSRPAVRSYDKRRLRSLIVPHFCSARVRAYICDTEAVAPTAFDANRFVTLSRKRLQYPLTHPARHRVMHANGYVREMISCLPRLRGIGPPSMVICVPRSPLEPRGTPCHVAPGHSHFRYPSHEQHKRERPRRSEGEEKRRAGKGGERERRTERRVVRRHASVPA